MACQTGRFRLLWRRLRWVARGGTAAVGLPELHAVTIRDSVSFPGAWEQFDQSGALRNPERFHRGMETLFARLNWWAVHCAEHVPPALTHCQLEAVVMTPNVR